MFGSEFDLLNVMAYAEQMFKNWVGFHFVNYLHAWKHLFWRSYFKTIQNRCQHLLITLAIFATFYTRYKHIIWTCLMAENVIYVNQMHKQWQAINALFNFERTVIWYLISCVQRDQAKIVAIEKETQNKT